MGLKLLTKPICCLSYFFWCQLVSHMFYFLLSLFIFPPMNKSICITERMTLDHCEQCAQLRPNSCSFYLYSILFEFKNVYCCKSTTLDCSGLPGTVYSHVNQTCSMLCIVSIVSGNLNYFVYLYICFIFMLQVF